MRTTRMAVGAIVAAGCVVSCTPRPGLTGSGERSPEPEPSVQPTSGSGSGTPQSPAPLGTEQPHPTRPGSPCSTLFPNLAPARAFPSDKDVGAMTLEGSPNGGATEAEIREALRAAQPLDPCDSSIPPWQYGPAGGARFTVAGAGAFHMSLFLGGRGILEFPDGAQIMFDWGDPSYAHYLPPAASSVFHRDWRHDASCKGGDETRPHFTALAAGVTDPAVVEAIGRLCRQAPNGSGWCCP